MRAFETQQLKNVTTFCEVWNFVLVVELEGNETKKDYFKSKLFKNNVLQYNINKTDVLFVRFKDYTCNLSNSELFDCCIYSNSQSGFAFIDRKSVV